MFMGWGGGSVGGATSLVSAEPHGAAVGEESADLPDEVDVFVHLETHSDTRDVSSTGEREKLKKKLASSSRKRTARRERAARASSFCRRDAARDADDKCNR